MQMVKKFFIWFLVLWFAVVFFMPKHLLYYKLEEILLKNDIKINEEMIEEGFFSLTLYDAKVYLKGIELATVKRIDFFTLLFYTEVEVHTLLLDDSLKNVVPTQIDRVEAVHALWYPLEIKLEAQGIFGDAKGIVSLVNRHIRLDFNTTKDIEMIKSNLKQDEKGWFYETDF